ncbi:MAG: hypothetical protein PHQ70_06035 [Arcobacter sp.]|uniref:hypothetical protein n=1 Tax=Arcobacter sp. TaxID=1872629 RepID=UPI002584A81D|nr:hypothetical protein [Arcobacter sp.]MDD3008412.1 hypothetical protein [Arcobacter sp.]
MRKKIAVDKTTVKGKIGNVKTQSSVTYVDIIPVLEDKLKSLYELMSNANIKRKTNSKSSFPTIDSAFKMLYISTQEVQVKWERTSIRNWSEIYPQLCIFFSEIMEKYTK